MFGVPPTAALNGSIEIEQSAITLSATSTNDASVDDIDIGIGAVTIEAIRPEAKAGGATRAFLGGSFTITADDVRASATSTNNATSDALNIELAAVGIDVPTATVSTAHSTEAFVARSAKLTVIGGGIDLDADSTNRADAGSVDVSAAAVEISVAETTMIAGGSTRSYVGEGATVKADSLGVSANSNNDANADLTFVNATAVKVSVAEATARTEHVTEAFIGPQAGQAADAALSGVLDIAAGGISLDAHSTNDASVSEIGVEVGGVLIDSIRPTVHGRRRDPRLPRRPLHRSMPAAPSRPTPDRSTGPSATPSRSTSLASPSTCRRRGPKPPTLPRRTSPAKASSPSPATPSRSTRRRTTPPRPGAPPSAWAESTSPSSSRMRTPEGRRAPLSMKARPSSREASRRRRIRPTRPSPIPT
jgi:hypothetical protein